MKKARGYLPRAGNQISPIDGRRISPRAETKIGIKMRKVNVWL